MPRPSRHVDRDLLRAGRELYPSAGCAGLTVRRVAQHARVNPGMFHYHFRTKDAFVRALLQGVYDEMFATLAVAAGNPSRPVESLRAALGVLARFARDRRGVVQRILADAADGHAVAREFLQANFPRHFAVIVGLVDSAQKAGAMKPVALPQAVAFLAGAVGAPVLAGGAMIEGGLVPPRVARAVRSAVLADEAIGERVDLALAALAQPRRSRR